MRRQPSATKWKPRPDLRGRNVRHGDFRYANLRWFDLAGTDFRFADLGRADLTGADIRQARLCGAGLEGANLTGANLADARLRGVDLEATVGLDTANLAGVRVSATKRWPPGMASTVLATLPHTLSGTSRGDPGQIRRSSRCLSFV